MYDIVSILTLRRSEEVLSFRTCVQTLLREMKVVPCMGEKERPFCQILFLLICGLINKSSAAFACLSWSQMQQWTPGAIGV